MRAGRTLIALLAVVFFMVLAACAGNNTAGDPAFASDLAVLESKVDGFLANLEMVAGTADGTYARHAAFYSGIGDELASLRTRAGNAQGNAAAVAGLDAISENLAHLEDLHRQGVSAAEVPVLRKLLAAQFNALHSSDEPPTAGKE
jgi:hypothetical protein